MFAPRSRPAMPHWMIFAVLFATAFGNRGLSGQEPPPPQWQRAAQFPPQQVPRNAPNTAELSKPTGTPNPTGILNLPADIAITPEPTPSSSSDAIDAISRQIQGKSNATAGQPIPEGLRELMKINGSVVDGTALDPNTEFLPQSFQDVKAGRWQSSPSKAQTQLRAAEALIKASRLLQKLTPVSKTHRRLAEEMRREAISLISQPAPGGNTVSATEAKPRRFLEVTIADSPELDHNSAQ